MLDTNQVVSESANPEIPELCSQKLKLVVFPATHFGPAVDEDIFVNKDDFPNAEAGDVLQIYQSDNEEDGDKPRLLLMVTSCLIFAEN